MHLCEAAIPNPGNAEEMHIFGVILMEKHDIKGHWLTLQIHDDTCIRSCLYLFYIYNVIIHKYTYSQGPDSVAKSEGNQNQPNSYRMQCILYVASPENWDCHFPMFKPIMFISGWSVIPIRWDFAWFALGACDLHPNAAEVVSGLPRAGAWQSQGGMLMI